MNKAAQLMGHTSDRALPVLQRAIEQAGWAEVLVGAILSPTSGMHIFF